MVRFLPSPSCNSSPYPTDAWGLRWAWWFVLVILGVLVGAGTHAHGQATTKVVDGVVRDEGLRGDEPRISPHASLDLSRPTSDLSPWRILGASSCAAASCHNGPRPGLAAPQASRGSEYALWKEDDPHARAYQALCGQQGRQMLERLKIVEDGRIVDQDKYNNCLKCHNTITGDTACGCGPSLREGVGCESCHGASAAWANQHYLRDWDAGLASSNGFVPLSDLVTRARICVQCHVGDDDRDMNHDLIAAGHPALRFEFTSYHARLPKHWREPAAANAGWFEAQLWLAGQVASLDASLALLEARAVKARPWPEFAEYECTSCHQDLRIVSPRPGDAAGIAQDDAAAAPSAPVYSNWYTSGWRMLLHTPSTWREPLARSADATSGDALRESLQQLRSVMQSSTRPDPAVAAAATRRTRAALRRWLAEHEVWRHDWNARQLVQRVAETGTTEDFSGSGEAASQFYLAAVAGRAAWPGGIRGPVSTSATQLREALVFSANHHAPRASDGRHQDLGLTRERLAKILKSLAEVLSESQVELQ